MKSFEGRAKYDDFELKDSLSNSYQQSASRTYADCKAKLIVNSGPAFYGGG
jgi:hypothetical protein